MEDKKLNQISDIKCSQILGVLILPGVGVNTQQADNSREKVLDIKPNTWLQTNKKCKVALKIFLVSNKIQALYSHFKFHFILHFFSHYSNFVVKFTSDGNRKENYFHFDARVGFRIYLRFVTVVGMAKAEQQSSEQGVQGRFS